jgi:tetratricopeptide (TPR) repeat protein
MAGRPKESVAEGIEAQQLDPLNAQFSIAPARAYIAWKRPDSAIAIELRALKLNPNLGSIYATLMWAYAEAGDTAKARDAGERSLPLVPANGGGTRALIAIMEGDQAAVAHLKSSLGESVRSQGMSVAYGYAFRHNADSALAWLDRAYEDKSDVLGIVQYPAFDWLRPDPRFKAIAARYGIPAPQR